MKRKSIALILVLTAALAAAGCGNTVSGNSTAGGGTSQETAVETKPEETAVRTKPEGTAGQDSRDDMQSTVTVTGNGSVSVTPDMAEVTFAVETDAKTAEESQQRNVEQVDAVIEALKAKGIEEKSIQTTGYYLNNIYDYERDVVTGYRTQTMLTVKDQKIEETGALISDAVAAGVNRVQNVRFFASTYDAAYAEALKNAVETARAKAEVLAAASGKTLGEVVSMTEGWQNTEYRYSNADVYAEEAAADVYSAKGLSMMAGEIEISAPVTVVYTLQ